VPGSTDPVIIEVGLNENRTRSENRHVPYSPAEIAEAAKSCSDAGASIVHYHGRVGEAGEPALSDPEPNVEAQRRITESTPLLAYPSYGSEVRVLDYYDVGTPAAERYGHIVEGVEAGVRFEIAPVDLGAFDVNARWDADARQLVPSSGLLMNTGRDHQWMLEFCRRHRLKPHYTVFDTAHFQNLANLLHWGWLGDPPTVVKLFLAGANATARTLLFFLERLKDCLPNRDLLWMPLVYGADQLPLCTLSLCLGGHVRVGIGDHAYRESGEPSNAEIVERVVTVARALGREPATPEEARGLMGLE
jgi:uncharacterized protein (DUF849 family)